MVAQVERPSVLADRGGPVQTEDERLADDLVHEVIRLVRLIERTRAHFTGVRVDGVEHAAYVLLCQLNRDGAMRASALADAVHSDPSTISRQVSALVKLGLVERRSDPEDGRACLLAATEAGERVFETHRRIRTRHIAALLAHWAPEERRQLLTLLDRFNTDFENYRPQIVGTVLGTPAPDTTAPDTTAPDTTAPDTTAPDTTAPDTTVLPRQTGPTP